MLASCTQLRRLAAAPHAPSRHPHPQAVAGNRVGSFADSVAVAPVNDLPNMPAELKHYAALASHFVQTSPLPTYDRVAHVGVWRTVTLRWAASTRQALVMLCAAPPTPALVARLNGAAVPPEAAAAVADGAVEAAAEARGTNALTLEMVAEQYQAELRRWTELFTTGLSSESAAASTAAASPAPPAQSVSLQEYSGVSSPQPNHPVIVLAGTPFIVERLCGLSFRLSADAFFQVNTPAAEQLYRLTKMLALNDPPIPAALMRERAAAATAATGTVAGASAGAGTEAAVADAAAGAPAAGSAPSSVPSPGEILAAAASYDAALDAALAGAAAVSVGAGSGGASGRTAPGARVLLDVCCGTGTIGLTMADSFVQVLGVEMSEAAVKDALENAATNGIANADFTCSRAETAMAKLVTAGTAALSKAGVSDAAADIPGGRFVAVVDPPRGGLHPTVIRALRTCRGLRSVVYISCNPTGSFIDDAIKLCAPKEKGSAFASGPPFRMVFAKPVDLFPDTAHTELVALLVRDK